MNLPKLQTPRYTLTLPSTKAEVEFRPFLVKEEKVLMIAQESGDEGAVIKAVLDVIESCTFGKLQAEDLPSYDIEYLFLKLRSKSVGEIADIQVACPHCDTMNPLKVNLDKVEVKSNGDQAKKIMLDDEIGIIPQAISAKKLDKISKLKDKGEQFVKMLIGTIESIFDSENVYPAKDASHKELVEFVSGLTRSQSQLIEDWIAAAPSVQHDAKFKCKNAECAKDATVTIKGTDAFF